jgi:aldose sugar dehydrogenase
MARVTEQEVIMKDFGRARDLRYGPDGLIDVVTNEPDRIAR